MEETESEIAQRMREKMIRPLQEKEKERQRGLREELDGEINKKKLEDIKNCRSF